MKLTPHVRLASKSRSYTCTSTYSRLAQGKAAPSHKNG